MVEDNEYPVINESDTSQFYIDNSPKNFDVNVHGFMAREKPGAIHWPSFNEEILGNIIKGNDRKVIILRSSLWFYAEQKTTLGNVREYFSEKGIALLEKDGYIKII